jgi:predicted ATPase
MAMRPAIERHDAILRRAIESNDGYVFRTEGDAFRAVFSTAPQALMAALSAQRALVAEPWPAEIAPLLVRMALHTGAIEARDGDYAGPSLNRMARLLSACHGGQILLSLPTEELVRDDLPRQVTLRDLGEHRLKDLIRPERIYQILAPGIPSEFPTLLTLDNRPNNLPTEPTPIIGRDKELAEIERLLARQDVRLLTLTGPGGTGKTRLALQAAAEMVGSAHYPDGVWFVDLAPVTNPSLVTTSIAQVLQIKEVAGHGILDTLATHLASKRLLLILDNFEHVVSAAPEVAHLLQATQKDQLKIIVTSRAPLKIRGEREYPVPALALPPLRPGSGPLPELEKLTQYDAVALFIERAQAVKPDFQVTNENAPAVAEICVKLDGLPLAIELAAARAKMLPPQAMLARLRSGLHVLAGGKRDMPNRQQTLRNAIEWSYNLLDESEKQLFRRMAVFNGGRTLEAVEAVCRANSSHSSDVLDGVQSLLDASLLSVREGSQQREDRSGEPRLYMLETIHEYAKEKLVESGEAESVQREHACYFVQIAEELSTQLDGPEQESAFKRLEDEHDNMRAALAWTKNRAAGGDTEAATLNLQFAGALRRFWRLAGLVTEGRGHLMSALSLSLPASDDTDALRARALQGAAILASQQGDYEAARSLNEQSLALYGRLGDRNGMAHVLNQMGITASNQGDFAAARTIFEEALALFKETDDRTWIGATLANLGITSWYQQDYATARASYEEALAIARESGDRRTIAAALGNLGELAEDEGEYDRAFALQRESLGIFRDLSDKEGIRICLEDMARLELSRGSALQATVLWAGVAAMREMMGLTLEPAEQPRYESGLDRARTLLGAESFEKAWQEGQAMSVEQAIEYALGASPFRRADDVLQ